MRGRLVVSTRIRQQFGQLALKCVGVDGAPRWIA
jgi:hypothetical protein